MESVQDILDSMDDDDAAIWLILLSMRNEIDCIKKQMEEQYEHTTDA